MDALPIILVVVALGIAGWLSQRQRQKMDEYRKQLEQHGDSVPPVPGQKLTRAQRRVEEFRASVSPPDTPSIEAIARAEAEDLGLFDMPGADGLPINVLLLVWRRDEGVRNRCDGRVGYAVDDGVKPQDATDAEVRLECEGELREAGDESGNNLEG